jgi:hypothetical protein
MDTNRTGFVREGWPIAVVKGVLMFVAAVVLLVILPDRLVNYLAPRTTPTRRDLGVVAAWLVGLILCCWLFVVIQRPWGGTSATPPELDDEPTAPVRTDA